MMDAHTETRSETRRLGRTLALAAGLLALLTLMGGDVPPRAAAQGGAVPPEWAYIPPESIGFVHFRFADSWDGEIGKSLRQQFRDEMPLLEKSLEAATGIAPADCVQLTLVLVKMPDAAARAPFDVKPPSPPIDFKDKEFPKEKEFPKDKDFPKEGPGRSAPGLVQVAQPKEILLPQDDPFEPSLLIIVTTRRAYDRNTVRNRLLPRGQEQKHQGKTYYVDTPGNFGRSRAVAFLSDTTFVGGSAGAVRRALELPAKGAAKGPVTPVLALTGGPYHLVAGFQMTDALTKEWQQEMEHAHFDWMEGGFLRAMLPLREVKSGALGVELGKQSRAQMRLQFADTARAKAAVGTVQDALVLIRIFSLGGMQRVVDGGLADVAEPSQERGWIFWQLVLQRVEAAVRAATVEQRGNELLAATQAATDVSGLLTEAQTLAMSRQADPAALQARNRRRSANNLKQIGLALHSYHDTHGHLPPTAFAEPSPDQKSKPGLSWRVAILPYLEEDFLYKQFNKNEPWDSPHNKSLIAKMPKVYAPIGVKTKEPYTTFYQGFAGPGAGFDGPRGLRLADFRDGLSNTILVVEGAEPVIWTKPDDLPYDPKKPLPKVGGLFEDGFHALFGDGSVSFLRKQIDEKSMRWLIERADGNFVDRSRFERR